MSERERCQKEMMKAGGAYPRSCYICGLGPCRYEAPREPASDVTDAALLDWLDTLQERRSGPQGHHNQRWHLTTDIHAMHGRWTIYLRDSRGDIVHYGQGVTFREAIADALKCPVKGPTPHHTG